MSQLLVRDLEPAIVRKLRSQAASLGISVERLTTGCCAQRCLAIRRDRKTISSPTFKAFHRETTLNFRGPRIFRGRWNSNALPPRHLHWLSELRKSGVNSRGVGLDFKHQCERSLLERSDDRRNPIGDRAIHRLKNPSGASNLERWLLGLETHYADGILPITAKIADRWGRLSPGQPTTGGRRHDDRRPPGIEKSAGGCNKKCYRLQRSGVRVLSIHSRTAPIEEISPQPQIIYGPPNLNLVYRPWCAWHRSLLVTR